MSYWRGRGRGGDRLLQASHHRLQKEKKTEGILLLQPKEMPLVTASISSISRSRTAIAAAVKQGATTVINLVGAVTLKFRQRQNNSLSVGSFSGEVHPHMEKKGALSIPMKIFSLFKNSTLAEAFPALSSQGTLCSLARLSDGTLIFLNPATGLGTAPMLESLDIWQGLTIHSYAMISSSCVQWSQSDTL